MSSSNRGPIVLGGSLGQSRLRSHQARPAAGRQLGNCGSRLAGLFPDSLPLLNELICGQRKVALSPPIDERGDRRERGTEGRKERLVTKDVV